MLACVQLTVRLIRAFSVRTTALGALALTPAFLAVAAIYATWLLPRLDGLMLMAGIMALAGYAVTRWVLRVRRQRGRVAASIGIALLAAPWPVFLLVGAR